MADVVPATHIEKVIAGQVEPATHLEKVIALYGGGGSGGTTNYNLLSNKPKVNGVELTGNKTLNDLGLLYTEDITTASNTWTIQHNLKTAWNELTINIVDADSNIIYGDIDVDNCTDNLLVVKFDKAISGKIIIRK